MQCNVNTLSDNTGETATNRSANNHPSHRAARFRHSRLHVPYRTSFAQQHGSACSSCASQRKFDYARTFLVRRPERISFAGAKFRVWTTVEGLTGRQHPKRTACAGALLAAGTVRFGLMEGFGLACHHWILSCTGGDPRVIGHCSL